MNEEIEKKSIKDTVLEKIKAGEARMIPRWHFALRAALIAVGSMIVFLLSMYVVSFILFILQKSGAWFLPAFGVRGLGVFLASIPWLLVISSAMFIIFLELLVRHYPFGYRKPLLYSVVGIIVFVAGASVLLSETRFHEGLYERAHTGELPIVGQLYKEYESGPSNDAYVGTIAEITSEGFRMQNSAGETVLVIVTSETSFPSGLDFQNGDQVLILADRNNGGLQAVGIRRIGGNMMRRHLQINGWYRPSVPMMGE